MALFGKKTGETLVNNALGVFDKARDDLTAALTVLDTEAQAVAKERETEQAKFEAERKKHEEALRVAKEKADANLASIDAKENSVKVNRSRAQNALARINQFFSHNDTVVVESETAAV